MSDKYYKSRGIDTGKPPKTQPPKDCDQCGAPLSRYRNATETACAYHPKIILSKGSYGMAQYMTAHREGKAALEELGYHEVGFGGNNQLVMEHPFAGRVDVHGSPHDVDQQIKIITERAKRQLKFVNKNVAEFVEHLRKKYMVASHDSVVVQTAMQKEIKQWAANRPPGSDIINISTFASPVMKGGYVRMLKQGHGNYAPSTIEIFGSEYVPPEDKIEAPSNADIKIQEDVAEAKSDPICGAQHPHFPAVWCTLPPDHDDMHGSEAVESGWWTTEDVKEIQEDTVRVPYYAKAAQANTGVEVQAPLKGKIAPAPVPDTPAVGVSDVKPQVADDTNEVTPTKTPQAGFALGPVISEDLIAAIRKELFPFAQTNADKLAQCKDLVKQYRTAIDAAYEILYRLENLLDK